MAVPGFGVGTGTRTRVSELVQRALSPEGIAPGPALEFQIFEDGEGQEDEEWVDRWINIFVNYIDVNKYSV